MAGYTAKYIAELSKRGDKVFAYADWLLSQANDGKFGDRKHDIAKFLLGRMLPKEVKAEGGLDVSGLTLRVVVDDGKET